jgi:putative CocE/NonD family hydrolase
MSGGCRKVSEHGQYRGYSKPKYKEWIRRSQYITVRDGTKLAVDVYRPAQSGKPADGAFPVLWKLERYHRADVRDGKLVTQVENLARLQKFLKHGYCIGIVDARGTGASFGTRYGPFPEEEQWDSYDITEWFASQEWCDGNVGMFGRSYSGIAQYFAASTAPPHLVAVFPEMAMFDLYAFTFSGGTYRQDFGEQWSRIVWELDTARPAAPVDEDTDGSLLAAAMIEHRQNVGVHEVLRGLPFRDSEDPKTGECFYATRSPSSRVREITASGIPIYHMAGWYDVWPRDALTWFANLGNPQKIIIGPWSHRDTRGFSRFAEQLRWFDFWLKGIKNGVLDDAPIYYYTMGAPRGQEWKTAWSWPLPEQRLSSFYLSDEPSRSVDSVNDGTLVRESPTTLGRDKYSVDYTTTSGKATRWTGGYGGAFGYSDMSSNDRKALTYTTQPLSEDVEVTGHPWVRLWIECTHEDVDIVVYLEEVDSEGISHYITEGNLQASHRNSSPPPYRNFGLPFHAGRSSDIVHLTAVPVELVFDMHPTSNVFDRGHRIRIAITGADRDNLRTKEQTPAPVITVLLGEEYASRITLPVIP